jgi:hypothetical protein
VLAFHEKHGYQPITKEAGPRNGLPSWPTAKRLFGSWNVMIEAAGLRAYPPRNSALAKVLAYRDRHPDWRQEMSDKRKRRLLADYDARTAG